MKLQIPKGVRDFPPEDMIIRSRLISDIKAIFEVYGYSPLETPVIERYDLLTAKFAAGDTSDIQSEIFKVSDRGKRELGLRFDLTVPLARFVGMNPQLKLPFKRYAVGTVYRDGPIKLGRYREFVQCDADIVGCKTVVAEVELIKMAKDIFTKLGLDAYIEVNDRKILFAIMEKVGIGEQQFIPVITEIDKIKKIGIEDVKKQIEELGVDAKAIDELMKVYDNCTDMKSSMEYLKGLIGEEILADIKSLVKDSGAKFNVFLARGLGYYTGMVFEGFLLDSDMASSICGGGRYDDMISDYLGSGKFPAVGISFGIEPIAEAMRLKGEADAKTVTKIYVIPIKTFDFSMKIVDRLRAIGIPTTVDLLDRGISKNLQYANFYDIPYVMIVGETEITNGIVKLKDMKSGKETEIKIDGIEEISKIL